jgi:hypothetical protein
MQNDEGGWADRDHEAEQFLRDAIEDDSEFSSAHMLLSIAVRLNGERTGRSRLSEALTHIEGAVALADHATPAERLVNEAELHRTRALILAAGIGATFDPTEHASELQRLDDRAIAAYQAVLQLRPNHLQALISLANLRQANARPVARIVQRLADIRPHSAVWQLRAAEATLAEDPERKALARRYVERARELPATPGGAHAWIVTSARLFEAEEAWLRKRPRKGIQTRRPRGRVDARSAQVDRAGRGPPVVPGVPAAGAVRSG